MTERERMEALSAMPAQSRGSPSGAVAIAVGERALRPARDPWLWAIAIACALVALVSMAGIARPLDRDEGAFLVIAGDILHGRVPYRDVFDQKAPGVYYLLAALLALTSHLSTVQQVLVARAAFAVTNLLTAAGLLLLGRRWWRLEVGALAACLWLLAVPIYGGDQLFTEPVAVACAVLAVVVAAGGAGPCRAFGAGLLLALGTIFKQPDIIALPGLALVLMAASAPEEGWWRLTRTRILALITLLAGVLIPWLVVCGLFALSGALGPMLDQVVISNVVRYPSASPSEIVSAMRDAIQAFRALWYVTGVVVAAGTVGAWRWLCGDRDARRAPSLGAATSVMIGALALLPFKSHAYPHYWLQVAPWAALLAALGFAVVVDALVDVRRASSKQAMLRPAGMRPGILLAWALVASIILVTCGRSLLASAQPPDLREQASVGAWIARYAPPGARLLVAPAEPEYYYLAENAPSDAFVYLLPINLTPSLLAQVAADICAGHYDTVVWDRDSGVGGDAAYFAGLAALRRTLTERYQLAAEHGTLQVYILGTGEARIDFRSPAVAPATRGRCSMHGRCAPSDRAPSRH